VNEFYVGYQARAPKSLAARMKRVSIALLSFGAMLAVVLMREQSPFPKAVFEFGVAKPYQGILAEWPYPMLLTPTARYLLVMPGKHGATAEVRGLDQTPVRLEGTLIERGVDHMLELVPGSLHGTGPRNTASETRLDLGEVDLTGEIVDSKCFLGVMNPGQGKVHRDCAARCISGGVPPAFLVKDASGDVRVILLTGVSGREILPMVAEPVRIRGRLLRTHGALALETKFSAIRRE
jgi:hypothetical protein